MVYTPLLTYRHEEDRGSELIPGLARDLPRVSADGETYDLQAARGAPLLRRQRRCAASDSSTR